MGVYIKGMEMPKACEECALNYDSFACIKTGSRFFEDNEFDPFKSRLEDCPLIPIPPHGRLIDADALYKDILEDAGYGEAERFNDYWLGEQPTIIPAEEEAE